MYSVAEPNPSPRARASMDPRGKEIAAILELRQRAIESRDLLYCSPPIRRLVEEEIPQLIAMLRPSR